MLKEVFAHAQNKGFALGAFNVCNLETLKAVVQAAQSLSSPVIIESSPGETKFIGMRQLAALVKTYREQTGLPIFLNLDHGISLESCQEAVDSGYNLVHFDGSKLALEENIKKTREVVEMAHAKGVLVEGEMDAIPETSIPHVEPAEEITHGLSMTDSNRAAEFVKKTGVDILAVFVGNLHGTYETAEKIDFERLKQIRTKVPCFLSLHGGSGIADEDIKKAIEVGGIVKVNVNTELRVAYRNALEQMLAEIKSVKMYEIMPHVIIEIQKIVENKMQLFNFSRKGVV